MHIIVFNEYYLILQTISDYRDRTVPNDNHKLTLFAKGGCWNLSIKVKELGLDPYPLLPTTLNSLPRFLGSSTKALLRNPLGRISAATRIIRSSSSFKRNLINIFRMLQLPLSSPDLCLVHNLNTMRSLTFLRSLYPGVPVALYYHGGELPGMSIISNDIAASAFVQQMLSLPIQKTQKAGYQSWLPSSNICHSSGFKYLNSNRQSSVNTIARSSYAYYR